MTKKKWIKTTVEKSETKQKGASNSEHVKEYEKNMHHPDGKKMMKKMYRGGE